MCDEAKAIPATEAVEHAVSILPQGRYLLAVSGGCDSMVLLDAFARTRCDAVSIATFDHGTGPTACQAAELVIREGARRGMSVLIARRFPGGASNEAAWRTARWRFLRTGAATLGASVVTAHSRDDQLETVVMRALRASGPRGLAAMYATSPTERPLISLGRDDIVKYAEARAITFVHDPSNDDMRYLRNRVRRDLLPALERARPGFGAQMLALARGAAEWRDTVDGLAVRLGATDLVPGRSVSIPISGLAGFGEDALAMLWAAIAGRVGVRLDWRGTERLVEFTIKCRAGSRIPLAGGATARRTSTSFVLEASSHSEALYS